MTDATYVNDRIKEIKKEFKLKQADISKITGYSINSIKKWMMHEEQQYTYKAPIQALTILENWINSKNIEEQEKILRTHTAEIWSFLNFKGGVGKTTITFNISLMLSNTKKVLVVDCDPQGHLSSSLIKEPSDLKYSTSDLLTNRKGEPYSVNHNLDIIGTDNTLSNTCESIPASDLLFLLKENLEKYKAIYDYIVIDSLPSKGALYDAILAASNKIIVPFTPDLYDSWGIQDVFHQVKKVKIRKINENIKVAALIPNRVDKPLRNFDQRVIESVREAFPIETCNTFISNSVRLKECKSPAISTSIIDYAPTETVAEEYKNVLNFILNS